MTARVNNTLSFWAVVLVYVILGLLEVDDVTARLRRLGNAADRGNDGALQAARCHSDRCALVVRDPQ